MYIPETTKVITTFKTQFEATMGAPEWTTEEYAEKGIKKATEVAVVLPNYSDREIHIVQVVKDFPDAQVVALSRQDAEAVIAALMDAIGLIPAA